MGNRFHFSVVQKKSGFHEGFSVAGGAGAEDFCIRRHEGIDFPDGADGGL